METWLNQDLGQFLGKASLIFGFQKGNQDLGNIKVLINCLISKKDGDFFARQNEI